MQTLSYGFKKPQNPDSGDTWFPAMSDNIQQLNDHNHDGLNSSLIAAQPGQVVTLQNISAAGWVAVSGGLFRQLVAMSASLVYDAVTITMRLSTGDIIYPQVEKNTSTSYYVYTNDNTKSFVAVYG